MEVRRLQINDIKPYEQNARKNDEAVDGVAKSIQSFGFINPIIIDEDNIILAGHTRFKAAQSLGLVEVPTVQVVGLTDEKKHAYRIADNKTGEVAVWDYDLLAEELEMSLGEFTGFGEIFEDTDNETSLDDYEEPEPDRESVHVAIYKINGQYSAEIVSEGYKDDLALVVKKIEV